MTDPVSTIGPRDSMRWALGKEIIGPGGRERIVLLEPRHVVRCVTCQAEIAVVRGATGTSLMGESRCWRCVVAPRRGPAR